MPGQQPAGRLAPLIAVVGSDGSGKSTLSRDVLNHVAKSRRVERGYLGLGTGEQGRKIGRLPLIGGVVHRWLDAIADAMRDPESEIPGTIAARYALRKSKKRRAQFERLLDRRKAGVAIVTDRYPQVEVPGLHDGPILAGKATSPAVVRIQQQERALYQDMASYVPNLVIRLHVDTDTAMERKPDHVRELIDMKVQSVPELQFNGATIVDIDATLPYEEELRLALEAVDAALASA